MPEVSGGTILKFRQPMVTSLRRATSLCMMLRMSLRMVATETDIATATSSDVSSSER